MTFREKIYQISSKIPKGKVATYGQLAILAKKPKAARAVGMFMRTNPFAPKVPCHRVVGSTGKLVGFSGEGGVPAKKKLLKGEGVSFIGDRVDLSKSLWKPSAKNSVKITK